MGSRLNIAIDGPAGSGKSTVAKLVAQRLGYLYIDSGAMYRAVTLKALREQIDLKDPVSVAKVALATSLELVAREEQSLKVLLDGEDVTEEIRSPRISRNVSFVAEIPAVRKHLVRLQQSMARQGGVVMEGRDIGTVVLPRAEIKVYLTASATERARRRQEELAAKGYRIGREQMESEIMERDKIDTSRAADPLKPAPDAEIIDCSALSAAAVAQMIVERVGAES